MKSCVASSSPLWMACAYGVLEHAHSNVCLTNRLAHHKHAEKTRIVLIFFAVTQFVQNGAPQTVGFHRFS